MTDRPDPTDLDPTPSGIDHNQDEDHYHLLLKIHEMRGLTIQSRFDTYLNKHGRDYAPSSFAADSTVLEANSTFHVGISQRHGPLDDLDPDSQADVTAQSTPSSAPDEFRPRRTQAATPSDERVGDLIQSETTTQDTASLDGLTIAFRTTPLLVDRQRAGPSGNAGSRSPLPRDRRHAPVVPAKESILQRISGPSPNPIKSKLPLLADVDSDTGSEFAAAVDHAPARIDRTEDGDDELGPSDLEMTPRRVKAHLRPDIKAATPGRSPRRPFNPTGYTSDSPVKPGRLATTRRTGYLSDGTPDPIRFNRTPLQTESFGIAGTRIGAPSSPLRRTRSPLSNPRGTSTPKASHVNHLMDGFSSMDDEPARGQADRSNVPPTYGGPVKQKTRPTPTPSLPLQAETIKQPVDLYRPPLTAETPTPNAALQRELERQAYELDRAYSAAGGDINELLTEAKAYHEAGIGGRMLERWVARFRQEKVCAV